MKRIIWTVLATAMVTGCGGGEEVGDEAVVADTMAVSPTAAGEPTDPQIAAIAVAANDVDIAAGQMAIEKGADDEVKAFGQRMVTDHSAVNQQATELVSRLGVTPEANPTSQQLAADGTAARERLSALSGADFDRAYIDNEVTYHETVLSAIDQTLIPSSENAELKALLEQVRPAIAAHLDHARQIQTRLAQ